MTSSGLCKHKHGHVHLNTHTHTEIHTHSLTQIHGWRAPAAQQGLPNPSQAHRGGLSSGFPLPLSRGATAASSSLAPSPAPPARRSPGKTRGTPPPTPASLSKTPPPSGGPQREAPHGPGRRVFLSERLQGSPQPIPPHLGSALSGDPLPSATPERAPVSSPVNSEQLPGPTTAGRKVPGALCRVPALLRRWRSPPAPPPADPAPAVSTGPGSEPHPGAAPGVRFLPTPCL